MSVTRVQIGPENLPGRLDLGVPDLNSAKQWYSKGDLDLDIPVIREGQRVDTRDAEDTLQSRHYQRVDTRDARDFVYAMIGSGAKRADMEDYLSEIGYIHFYGDHLDTRLAGTIVTAAFADFCRDRMRDTTDSQRTRERLMAYAREEFEGSHFYSAYQRADDILNRPPLQLQTQERTLGYDYRAREENWEQMKRRKKSMRTAGLVNKMKEEKGFVGFMKRLWYSLV